MRLGLITPVLTRLPGAHAGWEDDAGIDEVVRIAREADRLGFDHLTCSEHVAVPREAAAVRGGTYWDPLAVFGHLSAVTDSIRFATFVLVLGYHHPLEVLKRYGTLDAVSGGRLILGVGVGSLEEEFDLLGVDFADRGARADDALRALRTSLGATEPAYRGTHYDFGGFVVDPVLGRGTVPIWIGGRTARSLRRAVELGDGWAPFGLGQERLSAMLGRARDSESWQSRDAELEVALQSSPLDPLGEPAAAVEAVAELARVGATTVEARFVHHSVQHYLEQMAALADLVGI